MVRTVISKADQLEAVGPYSLAVEINHCLYVSGQIGIKQGKLVTGGLIPEFEQALANVQQILTQAGYQLSDVVNVTIYLTDINQYQALNQVYQERFRFPYPARTTVEVSALPLGAQIELSVIACHNHDQS